MEKPMKFDEGLKTLLGERAPEEICYVFIDSVHSGGLGQETIRGRLTLSEPLEISREREFHYTPPASASPHKSFKQRTEVLPVISDSKLCYLVIDGSFEEGGTLRSAANMLAKQGVRLEDIWFCTVTSINPFFPSKEMCLDRAARFLKYASQERIHLTTEDS